MGQKLTVKIVDRQSNETNYTYVVPGRLMANSTSNANCLAFANTASCNGSTTVTGVSMPPTQVSYQVRGATFSLLLPDNRVAVVNCESKFAEHFAGPRGNRRSCRIPLVDTIEAEFNGNDAKLKWSVSLDGKKMDSETYKILGVINPPKPE